MKFQFTTKSILLATAFVAIAIGQLMPVVRYYSFLIPLYDDLEIPFKGLLWYGPVYLPIIFGAYAAGRRRISWQIVLAFGVASGIVHYLEWSGEIGLWSF